MEVQIRRREEVSHLPNQVINESKVFLGSHFSGRGPLRGLSEEEEKKYLPSLIGVSTTHQDFAAKVKEFWADMGFLVPSAGVVLDVTKDENGNPYNVEDWIRYQWARKHKFVAESEEQLLRDPRKKFFIFDPAEQDRRKNADIQTRKAADVEFIKAAREPEKGRRIIRMMEKLTNPDILSDEQVENKLYDLKTKDPLVFHKIASDKKLDVKAEISEMISLEILRQVGNQIIYIDEVVAESIEDAVAWYQNPKNSGVITTLKAKLNEVKKRTS